MNALAAGLWTSITESSLRVGAAELRKREDVYLGFCIAAMVACSDECTASSSTLRDTTVNGNGNGSSANGKSTGSASVSSPHPPSALLPSKRASYEIQLLAVVQGKGAKSQRRLTIRSRLRAAFSLQLLASMTDISSKDAASDTAAKTSMIGIPVGSPATSAEQPITDLHCMVPFLECLAELQETRLPCSEEALMDALRPSMSYASPSSSSPSSSSSSSGAVKGKSKEQRHARADARALVRTWLHDEGYHQEVTSLHWPLQSSSICIIYTYPCCSIIILCPLSLVLLFLYSLPHLTSPHLTSPHLTSPLPLISPSLPSLLFSSLLSSPPLPLPSLSPLLY